MEVIKEKLIRMYEEGLLRFEQIPPFDNDDYVMLQAFLNGEEFFTEFVILKKDYKNMGYVDLIERFFEERMENLDDEDISNMLKLYI